MTQQRGPFSAVQFTRESSERIARVVRRAETTPSGGVPLTFRKVMTDSQSQIKMGTFTGGWSKDSSKTVTMLGSTATVMAYNVLFPHIGDVTPTRCVLARGGTAWYVANVEHAEQSMLINATLTSSSLKFDRVNVSAIKTSTTSVTITVVTCSTATA